jgi:hypothetical protein
MKKIILFAIFLICACVVNAQSPTGVPQLFNGKWYKFNQFLGVDSALLVNNKDTNWLPRQPALVFWQNPASDTSFWVYNGNRWNKVGVVLDTTSLSNRINLRVKYSDTASMLSPYLRKLDTTSLSNRINLKADKATTLTINGDTYDLSANRTWTIPTTDTTSLSNRINLKLNISDTAAMLSPYLRKVDTASLSNRINLKADKATTLTINGETYDLSANRSWTIPTTDTTSLSNRINLKLNISDTAAMLSPYQIAINARVKYTDTASMLAPYLRKLDTASLSNRINLKQDILSLTTTGNSGPATLTGATLNIPQYQGLLTNPITGTGTINTVAKFTSTTAIGNSNIKDDGNVVSVSTTAGSFGALQVGDYNGGIMINKGSSGAALIFKNTLSSDKLWDINPVGNDLSIDESNIAPPRMYFKAGGHVLINSTTDDVSGGQLQVTGSVQQSVTSSMLKASSTGVITAATAGTDYGTLVGSDTVSLSNRINTKQGIITLTTLGNSGPASFLSNVLNIPNYTIDVTGFVPYTGANQNVNLGVYDLTADVVNGSKGSFSSNGSGNTFDISHTSGSGIGLNITKGGNGEGLYINKTSGSGNAATIIGTLNATTLVKSGGTSSQFLKADGSVDSNTYLTTSSASTSYVPYTGATGPVNLGAYDLTVNALTVGRGGGAVYNNTAIGIIALSSNTTGDFNTATGNSALRNNTTANYNTANGYLSLTNATIGGYNTANGAFTLSNNTIGFENTAIGYNTLGSNISGNYNTGNGFFSLYSNTTGNLNTAFGHFSGYGSGPNANTTGSNNIFIGYNSVGVSATESNRTWIGNSSTTSTWLAGNVLIGSTTNAGYKIDVNGTSRVTGVATFGSTLSNGTYTYTLPSATGTLALTSEIPSVSGTTNYISKFTGSSTLGISALQDDGLGTLSYNATSSYNANLTLNALTSSSSIVTFSQNGTKYFQTGSDATGNYRINSYTGATYNGVALYVPTGTSRVLLGNNTIDNGTSSLQVAGGSYFNGTTQTTGVATFNSTLSNGTYTYTLPSASGTLALVGGSGIGTVTSVATGLGLSGGTITTSGTLLVDTASASILSRQRAANTYVPTSRTLTINGTAYDLSADRSWSITSMIYPGAGIAVSTGSAWGTSITDNSSNWNTAYTNRITSLTTTGTSGPATLISNVLNIPNYSPSPAARNEQTFTATAGQTTFSIAYTVGQLDVYYNGSKLAPSEFTATNGTSFTLSSAAFASDIVNAVAYITGAGLGGSGTVNELSYFTGSTTLGSLSTATYPSLTELSYVKGVTSSIQTQLNAKASTSSLSGYLPLTGGTLTNTLTTTGATNPLIIKGTNASTEWTEYYYNTSTLAGYIGNGSGILSGAANSDFIVRSESDFVVATGGNSRRLTIASTGAATFSSSVTAQTNLGFINTNSSQAGFVADYTGTGALKVSFSTYNDVMNIYNETNGYSIMNFTRSSKNLVINPSGGNVGIGNTNPSSYNSAANTLVVGTTSGNNGMTIAAGTTGYSGLYFADGTTGNEAFRGYIEYGHSADAFTFGTAASERMRITSGGDVGIGTTSPNWLLNLEKNSSLSGAGQYPAVVINNPNAAGYSALYFFNNTTNVGGLEYNNSTTNLLLNSYGALIFQSGNGTERMRITSGGDIQYKGSSTTTNASAYIENTNTDLTFYASSSGSVPKNMRFFYNGGAGEAMRITSGGDLLVGATTTPGAGSATEGVSLISSGAITAQRAAATVGFFGRSVNDGELFAFYRGTTQVGNISVTSSLTSYNVTSDYRLKQDFKQYDGLSLINKIKTYDYQWKSDKTRMYGVVAHELQEVIPYAVQGVKDGQQMQSVDYSKLVPLLIKSVQELSAKNEALIKRIETLENK